MKWDCNYAILQVSVQTMDPSSLTYRLQSRAEQKKETRSLWIFNAAENDLKPKDSSLQKRLM